MSAAATPTGVSKPVKPQALMQRTPSATMVELPPIEPISYVSSTQSPQEDQGPDPATEALIVDLQASIQEHLDEREAANERARKAEQRVKELQGVVQIKKELEQELHQTKESLNSAASDREHLLVELDKLREARDEHERKQIVLSNRLNAAKKKEAAKANLAESLDDNVKVLEHDYETAKKKAEEATAAQKELAKELATMKDDFQQRLKKTETQLSEERRLNDERKKKMKSFVENKQEEIRESKSQNDELNMELSQTNRSLREHHSRWKQLHAQWVQSQTRNRELQRDINRMKKESESMSRLGERMNVKMSQSAQETEEHKTKRLTAKQELMNVLEALESERDVSSKLRDSIKFTFTPKALSQQQILKESLREFEHELVRLSTRLGRPLPPSNNTPAEVFALEDDDEEDMEGSGSNRRTRSEIDSTHLLANLEDETQRVSQCIMALTSNIERLHIVVAQSGERTCVSLFSDLLTGASGTPESGGETAAMTGPRIGIGSARSYGQVPTANN
jgi:chromosome segregation ATPase